MCRYHNQSEAGILGDLVYPMELSDLMYYPISNVIKSTRSLISGRLAITNILFLNTNLLHVHNCNKFIKTFHSLSVIELGRDPNGIG